MTQSVIRVCIVTPGCLLRDAAATEKTALRRVFLALPIIIRDAATLDTPPRVYVALPLLDTP